MRSVQLWVALAAVACILLFSKPATPWEFDELLFFQGIQHYDPVAHHPPPPGYPVFIAAGHLLREVIPSDFGALVTLSVCASIASFALLALAFGAIAGELAAGITAALVFYLSPAMIVHAAVPQSEAGALALLALALYVLHVRGNAIAFGAVLALAVGWRIQFVLFAVPLLFASLFIMGRWRDRIAAVLAFGAVCAAWLLVLIGATGGLHGLIRFETVQAGYLVAHDAGESRSGWTTSHLALRFIAHPWGMKLLAFPILAAASIGVYDALRRRLIVAGPLAFAGLAYLLFALHYMDPADGVRYAIPFLLAVSLFAGLGIVIVARSLRITPYALAAIFGVGSIAYTGLMISQRAWSSSPPVQAAQWASSVYRSDSVALYELPLWPHATYFFSALHPMRIDDGLAKYFNRPDVPLFIYADGASNAPGARVFRWLPSDAYSKLTRNHYRVTSIIPLPPERRFKPRRGVYQTEREIEGDEWRWLAPAASMELPRIGSDRLNVVLGLPRASILDQNTVTISVDGKRVKQVACVRDQRAMTTIDLPPNARMVSFDAATSVVPAEHPQFLNFDTRRLAVKMYDFSLRRSAAPAAPQTASR